MKIALVTPPTNEHPITRDMAGGLGFDRDSAMLLPPLDFLYAASQLRNEHQEVLLIDGDHTSQFQGQLQKNLEKFAPDIVLVMVSLPTLKSDCAFAKGIRGAFACQVAIRTGISHPPVWEEILNKSRANFLVFGECEIRIGEILSGKIKAGTAWIERNKLQWQTGINISQLDSLPLPDWGLLGKLTEYRYPLLGNGVVTLQTSRGCPFPCSFYCPYPLVQGHEWRAMTSYRMFSEVCNVFQYGISRILFRDAVFTYDRNRTIEFCEKVIHEHLPIFWWCESRADRLDEDLLRIMKNAGCLGINVGVESGDAKVRQKLGKAGLRLPHLKKLLSTAKRTGLKIHLLFMAGLPEENRKSLYLTYSLIKKLHPDTYNITLVTPYPGTPLFFEAQSRRVLPELMEWNQFGGNSSVIPTKFLSKQELVFGKRWIDRLLRFRYSPNPIRRILSLAGELYFSQWVHVK